jgi:beta-barrel assembly-enhancing protease
MNVLTCASAAVALSLAMVSVQEEIAIGRQANAQVRKQVPQLRDATTSRYVSELGMRLARVAPGPKYPYSFAVADYREINAFSLPGGPVWINRGVLQVAGNESQVAGVLAHEIAHIARRHAADQLTKVMVANWGLGLLGAVLGNTGGANAAQVAARFIANGVVLKFNRDDERDADQVGLRILQRAGWDPRGMVELFEVLERTNARNPGAVEVFFSTHPAPADRIRLLQADVAKRRGGRRDSSRFQEVRKHVRGLSPARAMPRG